MHALVVTFRDGSLSKELSKPCVVTAPEVEFPVGEDIETRHPCLEEFRKSKVSAFMKEDKQCYRKDKLCSSYQKNFHFSFFLGKYDLVVLLREKTFCYASRLLVRCDIIVKSRILYNGCLVKSLCNDITHIEE